MPLFKCSVCHCVENTALGHYWVPNSEGEPVLCSECHTGEWHGQFDKKSATGWLIDDNGTLWSKKQVDAGLLPKHYKIVGEVPPKCIEELRDAIQACENDGLRVMFGDNQVTGALLSGDVVELVKE